MGVILRQGFKHSLITLISTLVGMVNVLFLYTTFLSKEEFGLYQYLISTALFITTFVTFGFGSVSINYFPLFRKRAEKDNGFLFLLLAIPTIIFSLFALICYLLQSNIYGFYVDHPDADLLLQYLPYILPLVFFFVLNTLLTSYISNFKRIVVPELLNNLLLKLMIPVFAAMYYFDYINFSTFIYGIIAAYFTAHLGLLVYLWSLGELQLKPKLSYLDKDTLKNINQYALYSVLSGMGSFLATKIDVFMVGTLIDMKNTAIFTVALYISTVISIPLRSTFNITSPIIASSFRNGDLANVRKLYRKTSLNLLIVGVLILLGIWTSIDYLFELIPNGETYKSGKSIILILGFAKLVDMATGINTHIIIYSRFYKFNFYLSLVLAIINVVLNLIFIPLFGIIGVALATFSSIVIFNLLKVAIVWRKLNMNPFSWSMLWVLVLGLTICLSTYFLPKTVYPLANIIIASLYIGIVYFSSILFFKLSEDFTLLKESLVDKAAFFFSLNKK